MKKKYKGKILTLLMSLAMAFTMMPMISGPVYADDPAPAAPAAINLVENGSAPNITGAQTSSILFGDYKQSPDGSGDYNEDPIKWRVLQNAEGKLLLLSDQNLDVMQYHTEHESVTWDKSTMRSWLNGYDASKNTGGKDGTDYSDDSFIGSAFSSGEQSAIATTTVVNESNNGTLGENETADKVFLLSISEARNTGFGFADDSGATDTRVATNTAYVARDGRIGEKTNEVGQADSWWLRSPGNKSSSAAKVLDSGSIYVDGDDVNSTSITVRPALNVDLGSVILTSAAKNGKASGTVGAHALAKVGTNADNEWKLTVKDADHGSFAVSSVSKPCNSNVLSVSYSGAVTGNNEYISAIIKDKDGNVKYYGNLKKCTSDSDASGTVEINVDGKFGTDDALCIFNEQLNGTNITDFASELIQPTITEEEHSWNAGEVTKPATEQAEGEKIFTCTVCGATKPEAIAKLPSAEGSTGSDGTAGGYLSAEEVDKAITGSGDEKDIKGSSYAPLMLKSTSQGRSNIRLTWKKSSEAAKYVVYGSPCNSGGKKYRPVKLAEVSGGSYNVKRTEKKKVKKGTYYKFIVIALDGNGKVVSISKTIHAATKGGKVGNHKSVTVKAKVNAKGKAIKKARALSRTVLKKGKSLKLSVKMNPVSRKQRISKHVGTRYESSDTGVAAVSGGRIKAKAKGTCTIYVYAQNGVSKKIKITVMPK